MNYSGRITDIAGITVGHHTDLENGTGCTVILCEEPANAGMEVRGAAPGSRETALLDPLASAQWVNAITLTGGSAFGLDAPGGVVRYLEEQGVGVRFGRTRIPLVPAAVVLSTQKCVRQSKTGTPQLQVLLKISQLVTSELVPDRLLRNCWVRTLLSKEVSELPLSACQMALRSEH